MGIRRDQLVGHCSEALAFLRNNTVPPEYCSTCGRPYNKTRENIGYYSGIYNDKYKLSRIPCINNQQGDEFLQYVGWGYDHYFFLGLRVYDVNQTLIKEYKWTKEDIQAKS